MTFRIHVVWQNFKNKGPELRITWILFTFKCPLHSEILKIILTLSPKTPNLGINDHTLTECFRGSFQPLVILITLYGVILQSRLKTFSIKMTVTQRVKSAPLWCRRHVGPGSQHPSELLALPGIPGHKHKSFFALGVPSGPRALWGHYSSLDIFVPSLYLLFFSSFPSLYF